MLVPLLAILAMCILMVSFLGIVKLSTTKENVKQYAREYMLEMESVGYLSAASKTALQQKLTGVGVTGIDFSGTTCTEVGYGSPIYLNIQYSIPYFSLNTDENDLLKFFFEATTFADEVHMESTAKN